MEGELNTIVDFGATCIDVTVDHNIFGEIRGKLEISSRYDVMVFLKNINEEYQPLSIISNGVHIHKIGCRDEKIFKMIKEKLREKGFLYE